MSIEDKLDILIELLTKQQLEVLQEQDCKYTIGEWSDEWLKVFKAPKLRELTYIKYKGIIDNYIKPLFGDMKLNELSTIQAQKIFNAIPHPREREHILSQMRSIYKSAIRNELVNKNPLEGVELPKHKRKQTIALTREQETKFINACLTEKHGLMFIICIYAGLRRGEVLALNHNDIQLSTSNPLFNPPREKITVTKSLNHNKVADTKTKAGNRAVPILVNLRPYVLPLAKKSDKRIFPISEKTAYEHFQNILKKSGLDGQNITIHSLRHTFITRCYENGIDPKTLSKWVGHTTPAMTMDIYTHCNTDFEDSQIENINNTIKNK